MLIHEARHIEVGQHPCEGSHDNLISDLGAAGCQNLFKQFLVRHSDPAQVPPEYRPTLLWEACIHREGFCQEPPRPCETE